MEVLYMVCPNCGHEISPNQNFCENCGLPLKKNIVDQNQKQPEKEDAVKSLSDLENELDEQDKQEKARQTISQSHQSSPDDIDDKTQVYNFKNTDFNQKSSQPKQQLDPRMEMAPAQKEALERQAGLNERPKAPDNLHLDSPVHLDPVTHLPVYPDDKPVGQTQTRESQENEEAEGDGLLSNMWAFLKNNIYLDIIAAVLVVILFFIKRNYSWILLAIFLVAWFLSSQLVHGKEVRLNKLISRHGEKNNSSAENTQQQQQQQQQPQNQNYQQANYQNQNPGYNQNYNQPGQQPIEDIPRKKKHHKEEESGEHKRTWQQKLIIISSIVAFIASVTGPFVNGVSLTSTIASAANYSVNLGVQTTLIMNVSSAVRFICFISPVIALIVANFRSRGSIRILKTFTMLPSIIYIVAYALFKSNVISASIITGQTVTDVVQIGTSFYILIITSVLSLILAYTLHPRNRK
jgi:hypothetical protein